MHIYWYVISTIWLIPLLVLVMQIYQPCTTRTALFFVLFCFCFYIFTAYILVIYKYFYVVLKASIYFLWLGPAYSICVSMSSAQLCPYSFFLANIHMLYVMALLVYPAPIPHFSPRRDSPVFPPFYFSMSHVSALSFRPIFILRFVFINVCLPLPLFMACFLPTFFFVSKYKLILTQVLCIGYLNQKKSIWKYDFLPICFLESLTSRSLSSIYTYYIYTAPANIVIVLVVALYSSIGSPITLSRI